MTGVDICKTVAERHGFLPSQLPMKRGVRNQSRDVVRARSEAAYLMRRDLKYSLARIGLVLGMHHSSVLSAIRRVSPDVQPASAALTRNELEALVRDLAARVAALEASR